MINLFQKQTYTEMFLVYKKELASLNCFKNWIVEVMHILTYFDWLASQNIHHFNNPVIL